MRWFLLVACGASELSVPAEPVPDPAFDAAVAEVAAEVSGEAADPGELPYTAEQIRAAMPVGQVIRWRMEMKGVSTESEWRVRAADADSMTLETLPDGAVQETTWEELREHARFEPADTTLTRDVPVNTALGETRALFYVVSKGMTVRRYWFAPELPGPPVRHEVEVAGERTFSMEQTSRERVDPADWPALKAP